MIATSTAREGRSYASTLLGALAAALGVSIVVAWIAASYFSVDVVGSLVWPGDDGFCDVSSQGLGVHCFSDIALHLSVGPTLVPSDPGLVQYVSNLPPGNRLLLWVFQVLASGVGFRATIAMYLVLSALALIAPGLWAVRHRPWSQAVVTVLLISVATVPFLAVLDRGNTIAFAVPLLLIFVVSLWRGNDLWAIGAIALAAQIKPQFGLLIVGFFILRRFRAGVLAFVASSFLFLASFLVFAVPGSGSSPLQEFKRFVLFSQVRGSYLPMESDYPVNISFQKVIFELGDGLLGISLPQSLIQLGLLAVLGLVIAALVWRGGRIPYPVWIAVLLMSSALIVAVTFIYYYALVLVVVALLVQDNGFDVRGRRSRVMSALLGVAVVLSLTPLLIPAGWVQSPVPAVGNGTVVSLVPYIASATWLALTVLVAVLAVTSSEPKEQSADAD